MELRRVSDETVPFSRLRELEDRRVRMRFADGSETIAFLLSATQDMDGTLHFVYDRVEWSNNIRESGVAGGTAWYADGASLITIEEA